MSSRLRKAIAALMALVLLGVGLSAGEAVLSDVASHERRHFIDAQTMASAALGGTVNELLASSGATVVQPSKSDGMPRWLAEVLPQVQSPSQIMAGQEGKVVSLHWREGESCVESFVDALAAAGWVSVDSGVAGCASYVRNKGDEEWLLVSEWRSSEGLVVLVQCA